MCWRINGRIRKPSSFFGILIITVFAYRSIVLYKVRINKKRKRLDNRWFNEITAFNTYSIITNVEAGEPVHLLIYRYLYQVAEHLLSLSLHIPPRTQYIISDAFMDLQTVRKWLWNSYSRETSSVFIKSTPDKHLLKNIVMYLVSSGL